MEHLPNPKVVAGSPAFKIPLRLRVIDMVEMWEIYGTDCVFAAAAAKTEAVEPYAKLRLDCLLDARDGAVVDEERAPTGNRWPLAPALVGGNRKDSKEQSSSGGAGRSSEEAGKPGERPSKKKGAAAAAASKAGGAKVVGKAREGRGEGRGGAKVVRKTSRKSSAGGAKKCGRENKLRLHEVDVDGLLLSGEDEDMKEDEEELDSDEGAVGGLPDEDANDDLYARMNNILALFYKKTEVKKSDNTGGS